MLDMKFGFSVIGLVIFMLPMFINIVFFKYPPINEQEENKNVHHVLEFIEQGTRVLYAVAICIMVSNAKIEVKSPWLYLGILFLVLYYLVWIRYFVGGRDTALLGKRFLFVPMPLAVFPVLYFIFSSLWIHNYISVIIMVIFGIAHNINSYKSLNK